MALRHTKILPVEGPNILTVLKRRKRGCITGAKHRERNRWYKPCLQSVIMENMRSLTNKMEELTVLARLQMEYWECSIMCFTDT